MPQAPADRVARAIVGPFTDPVVFNVKRPLDRGDRERQGKVDPARKGFAAPPEWKRGEWGSRRQS